MYRSFLERGGHLSRSNKDKWAKDPQILVLVYVITTVAIETLPLLLVQHIKLRTSVAVEQSCHVSAAWQRKAVSRWRATHIYCND